MFLKIAGSLLIIFSSSMFGYYYSNRDNYRIKALEDIKKALIILKSQIEFSLSPLPDAMLLISKRTSPSLALFFEYVANRLNERTGYGIDAIWQDALQTCLKKTYLESEDIDYFKSLGNTLGYLDMKLQTNGIQIMIDYIDTKCESLQEVSGKNKKLYSSLGILGGILVAVVFL